MSDDNVFSPGADFRRPSAPRQGSNEPAPVDLMPIFARAWQMLLDNLATVGVAIIVLFAIGLAANGVNFAISFASFDTPPDEALPYSLAQLAFAALFGFVQLFVQLGMLKMLIDIDRGNEGDLAMLWSQGGSFLGAVLASIIIGFATLIGSILLLVPGIIIGLGLSMTLLIIVDQEMGPIDALGESWALTDGRKVFLFVQGLVMFVFGIVAYCVSCGLLTPVVAGFYACVQAVTYNALRNVQG